MNPQFTNDQYIKSKSDDLLTCNCCFCSKNFLTQKKYVKLCLDGVQDNRGKYCSKKCQVDSMKTRVMVKCMTCGDSFFKRQCEIKKSKNNFCSPDWLRPNIPKVKIWCPAN